VRSKNRALPELWISIHDHEQLCAGQQGAEAIATTATWYCLAMLSWLIESLSAILRLSLTAWVTNFFTVKMHFLG